MTSSARSLLRIRWPLLAALAALAFACSDDATGEGGGDSDAQDAADGGGDGSDDGASDSGEGGGDLADDVDAVGDPDPDAVLDADAPVLDGGDPDSGDLPPDDSGQADADAATDLVADSGDGGDGGDGGSTWTGLAPFDWDFCPGAETYVGGENWEWSVQVTEDALFCKMFDDVQWECCEGAIVPIIPFTQPERWNDRFEMRVVAGTYPVPANTEAQPIRVPVCVQFADGRQGVTAMTVMGSVTGTGTDGRTVIMNQPLLVDDASWTANIYVLAEGEDPLVLDGSQTFWGGSSLSPDEMEYGFGAQSCIHENARRDYLTTITYPRGELRLRTRIGDSPASTEPGVFYLAEGTLDGVAFTQSDRWHLWYEVQHHHFVQYYVVLFSQNIGDVCGLEVLNAAQYADDLPDDFEIVEIACEGLAPPEIPLGANLEATGYSVVNEGE